MHHMLWYEWCRIYFLTMYINYNYVMANHNFKLFERLFYFIMHTIAWICVCLSVFKDFSRWPARSLDFSLLTHKIFVPADNWRQDLSLHKLIDSHLVLRCSFGKVKMFGQSFSISYSECLCLIFILWISVLNVPTDCAFYKNFQFLH